MLSSIPTPILLILAGVIGLLIGLLVSTMFGRETKPSTDSEIPEKLVKEGYSEAARLFYSPASQKTVTFLDGDYYEEFVALTPEQKRRVVRLINSWNEWGGVTPKPKESAATAPVMQQPTQEKPLANMPPLPKVEDLLSPAPKPETLEDLGIEVVAPVVPVPAVINFRNSLAPKIQEKPKTFVDQINEKLEEIVAGTPNEKRGIRLEDNGHQGVIVWVGINHYDGVDKVPFPDVQDLIKKAVARWEEESETRK